MGYLHFQRELYYVGASLATIHRNMMFGDGKYGEKIGWVRKRSIVTDAR